MHELAWLLVPLAILAALGAAAALGGGTDLDYRRHEERTAYLNRDKRSKISAHR